VRWRFVPLRLWAEVLVLMGVGDERGSIRRFGAPFRGTRQGREGREVVRVWSGRKGWRSLRGDGGTAGRGGVVERLGEMGAEEKWSDGEAGSS
jgi:hypothetical protein